MKRREMEEIYVSVDIEADGNPIPDYSMTSFGASIVYGLPEGAKGRLFQGRQVQPTFYRELKPISEKVDPKAAKVAGLDRNKLIRDGTDPRLAMLEFAEWLTIACAGNRPVFVGFNAPFDWKAIDYYFCHFIEHNPFGINALDIKGYYMGVMGLKRWSATSKARFEKVFLSGRRHTHNALDDAIEQGEIFRNIREFADHPLIRKAVAKALEELKLKRKS